uniref:GIR1-like zinc ribbon domain-containing protein n=1 Tax=Oryza barthii TaxID=65489 RepID=A0A0D3HRN0_9ORYZ
MGVPSPPPPPPSPRLSHGLLRRHHRSGSSAAATAYSAAGSFASASAFADNAEANLAAPKEEHDSGRHGDGGAEEEHGSAGAEEKHGDDVEEEHGGGGSGFLGSPLGTAPGTELVPPGTKLYRPLDRGSMSRSNGNGGGGAGDKSPMVIGACTRCLMYCMVAKKDYPTCINCKQPSLVDLLQNQDAAAADANADKKRGGKRK